MGTANARHSHISTGQEVDLLVPEFVPEGARVHAIDVKAGATVNPD